MTSAPTAPTVPTVVRATFWPRRRRPHRRSAPRNCAKTRARGLATDIATTEETGRNMTSAPTAPTVPTAVRATSCPRSRRLSVPRHRRQNRASARFSIPITRAAAMQTLWTTIRWSRSARIGATITMIRETVSSVNVGDARFARASTHPLRHRRCRLHRRRLHTLLESSLYHHRPRRHPLLRRQLRCAMELYARAGAPLQALTNVRIVIVMDARFVRRRRHRRRRRRRRYCAKTRALQKASTWSKMGCATTADRGWNMPRATTEQIASTAVHAIVFLIKTPSSRARRRFRRPPRRSHPPRRPHRRLSHPQCRSPRLRRLHRRRRPRRPSRRRLPRTHR